MSSTHTLLCLDAGNTRVKWALVSVASVQGGLLELARTEKQAMPAAPVFTILSEGAVDSALYKNPDTLPDQIESLLHADRLRSVSQVLLCNVLGDSVRQAIEQACRKAGRPCDTLTVSDLDWIVSKYENPRQLGLDRWAACLAVAGETKAQGNLVVGFGTATTVDALVKQGGRWVHWGGFIAPGVSTMLGSLHLSTAQLPLVGPSYQSWPTSTEQAIGAGAVRMQTAMVQSLMEELQADVSGDVQVWFSGGHAGDVSPAFPKAIALDHAVFKGLLLDFSHRNRGQQ